MVAPTCFGITLPSSGSVPSAFWEIISWAVNRILWMGVLCLVMWRIFLLGILIFKGLTARRVYKSFGVKGLTVSWTCTVFTDTGWFRRNGQYLLIQGDSGGTVSIYWYRVIQEERSVFTDTGRFRRNGHYFGRWQYRSLWEQNRLAPPVSAGCTFQDLPRLRETADNTERYIHNVIFV
jgi:hypothetical protein